MSEPHVQLTHSQVRLTRMKASQEAGPNWLFIPGGPGMGAEYFAGLTHDATLPGTLWHVDMPHNGAYRPDTPEAFETWGRCLVEVCQSLSQVILVGHSWGGMLALTCPALENILHGLVLLNSSPKGFLREFEQNAQHYQLPDLAQARLDYKADRSDDSLKQFCIAMAEYYFLPSSIEAGKTLFSHTSMNHRAFDWAVGSFFPTYQATWLPKHLPTLVVTSSHDHITPKVLFEKHDILQQPSVTYVCLEDAGHFSWLEQCQPLLNTISQWFSAI